MDRFGRVFFRVEGLSMERLLNHCAQTGLRLYGVRRASARELRASASPADFAALSAFASGRGWRVSETRAAGLPRARRRARGRAPLLCGALVFLALCWAVASCVWFVEVDGAGPYEAEVRRILASQGVRPGRFHAAVSADKVRQALEDELTGLSWVGVYRSGVRLRVQCVPAAPPPPQGARAQNLVASRDGVVRSLVCRAGTPRVAPGDAVRAGDVLIEGAERGSDGKTATVQAQGSVTARVWHAGEAFVSATVTRIEPTGQSAARRVLCAPDWSRALDARPGYARYEIETKILRVGGALPVWLVKETWREVETREETRPLEDVRREAGEAALRLAHEKAGGGVQIIDKWVEYSMIQKEGCRARAVVEVLEEIALPSPKS